MCWNFRGYMCGQGCWTRSGLKCGRRVNPNPNIVQCTMSVTIDSIITFPAISPESNIPVVISRLEKRRMRGGNESMVVVCACCCYRQISIMSGESSVTIFPIVNVIVFARRSSKCNLSSNKITCFEVYLS